MEDETDAVRTHRRQFAVTQLFDGRARDVDVTGGRTFECARNRQQGGLARSGRSDNRDEFAGADGQCDRTQCPHGRCTWMRFGDLVELECVHCATTTVVPAVMPAPVTWTCDPVKIPVVTPTR